jgi:ribosomal protein L3
MITGLIGKKMGMTQLFATDGTVTPVTVILAGEVEMAGKRYQAGDIVVIEPGEETDFRALTDATNVVVKVPGAPDDKFERQP